MLYQFNLFTYFKLIFILYSLFFPRQVGGDRVNEYEVWHGLADLYSRLSHWKDMEVCLGKAKELKPYSAEVLYTEGKI